MIKRILLRPIITEKSIAATAKQKYSFKVANTAKKPEIASAVENLYKVNVEKVNVSNFYGKIKNYRGIPAGQTKNYKKAQVTLKTGQKIADFMIKE